MPLRTSSRAPIRPDRGQRARRGERRLADHLEQRRLARPVDADDPVGLARLDVQVDVAQDPAVVAALAPSATPEELDLLLEQRQGAVGAKALPDLLGVDRALR